MMHSPDSWTRLQLPNSGSIAADFSLDNRGLAYGDGFFTTMGVIDGVIVWQDYHGQRIYSHAIALQLDIDSDALLSCLQVHAQQLQQGMLKLIVTRAPQTVRGYSFTPNLSGSECEIWLKAMPMNIATIDQWQLPNGHLVPMQPVISAACLTAQLACLPPPLAGLKSLNRLDNVLASGELQRLNQTVSNLDKKFGEGLVRDMNGYWVEGTMSNVFYRLDSQISAQINAQKQTSATAEQSIPNQSATTQWYTPPLERSGVRGVMRTVIIDGFATSATPIVERALMDEDLPNLSQLFFCNALRGIMPVSSLTLLSGEIINFA